MKLLISILLSFIKSKPIVKTESEFDKRYRKMWERKK